MYLTIFYCNKFNTTDIAEFMMMFEIHESNLSSDILRDILLQTTEFATCEHCERLGQGRVKLEQVDKLAHTIIWDMTQDEWNRGKISLKELLTKGTCEINRCQCDICQCETMRAKRMTITRAPEKLLINLNRAVNMLDRNVANSTYFVHDESNHIDIITYPVTCPLTLQYEVSDYDENNGVFSNRKVGYSLQGVICVTIQSEEPLKTHYDCHCLNEEGKWVHYDEYISQDSTLFDTNPTEFESSTVAALLYKQNVIVIE